MNTAEITPRVRRASEWLEDLARRYWQKGESRLPTVAVLARMGRFSPVTIVKALNVLRQRGIIRASQRLGIHVSLSPDAAGATPLPAPSNHVASWRHVRDRVTADIIAGVFLPGEQLPTIKELSGRYGVSFATVRRALTSLVAARRLTRYKRGYQTVAATGRLAHATLVLIAHSDTLGDIGTAIPRHPEFLRILERECLRLNIGLDIRDEAHAGYPDMSGGKASRQHAVPIGYIVWMRAIPFAVLCSLLRDLESTQKPVAVMDENGDMPVQPVLHTNPFARLFVVASSMSAGMAIGNHLITAGHRRIGYMTPVGKALYCRNRYEGLVRAFESAGLTDAVVRFALNRYASFEELVAALASRRQFRSFSAHVARFTADRGSTEPPDPIYRFYSDTLVLRRAIFVHLRPMLEKAMRDPSITAVVGVNDWTALIAMAYARNLGMEIPQRMAFAGFDDTFEAFSHGLTSYDYNMPGLVHAILNHILTPAHRQRRQAPHPLEIPGIVRARNSTRHDPRQTSTTPVPTPLQKPAR